MTHSDPHITALFKKYLEGTVTIQELDELLTYFGLEEHTDLFKTLVQEQFDQPVANSLDPERLDAMIGLLDETVLKQTALVNEPLRFWRTAATRALPYAAAILITVSVGIWFLFNTKQKGNIDSKPTIADIAPGGNRATLTLTDGRTISLDEARDGIVIGGNEIVYNDGSPLVEVEEEEQKRRETSLLELSTPKGGTYQITLSDGTAVWLNAASTLKYPPKFSDKERVVEIVGEAYFAVAKRAHQPFKVICDGQQIQVLGTEFNISAYMDEAEIKTTLVEGSVQILNDHSGSVNHLAPSQQSVVRASSTQIQQVSVQPYIAWKEGYFYFKHTAFEEVMRQLARWYDVEVVYTGGIPQETFSGEMGRNLTLNAALKLLNVSSVQVQRVDGDKLIVH